MYLPKDSHKVEAISKIVASEFRDKYWLTFLSLFNLLCSVLVFLLSSDVMMYTLIVLSGSATAFTFYHYRKKFYHFIGNVSQNTLEDLGVWKMGNLTANGIQFIVILLVIAPISLTKIF